jgi:hypothetical protein
MQSSRDMCDIIREELQRRFPGVAAQEHRQRQQRVLRESIRSAIASANTNTNAGW